MWGLVSYSLADFEVSEHPLSIDVTFSPEILSIENSHLIKEKRALWMLDRFGASGV